MTSKIKIIDRVNDSPDEIQKWKKNGYVVVCQICKSELEIYENYIRCPQSTSHFEVTIQTKKEKDFLRQFY